MISLSKCQNIVFLSNYEPHKFEKLRSVKNIQKLTSVPDKKVVEVVIGVWVLGLESEHRGVGGSVELDHGLHGQGPVDEVGRLVVDVLHLDDHTLVVRICNNKEIEERP